jgi:hypothetical protein
MEQYSSYYQQQRQECLPEEKDPLWLRGHGFRLSAGYPQTHLEDVLLYPNLIFSRKI